ncbi:hypothetical protein B0T17DRAFT_218987 [Bombardia bombarda]|uniref:Uncharacterized protein n=1 Tax=Bombardia bombarda TaxID=252184 RepID=A0AA39XAH8_9PEZI|nr:hypothetical protein B0T17DRAFT_218987 [Bombardia bombarda]
MSDALQIVVVASPFANMSALYEVDPEADVLLILPPYDPTSFAPWTEDAPSFHNGALADGRTSSSSPGLRIKVSSKHLSLASRPFRNKLQLASAGKNSLKQSDGRVHLSLSPEFDPKAVTIVMNAIHGRGSKVPKSVDIETLAKIALFVDRFQLLDAVEVYADRWVSKLVEGGGLPAEYGRGLVLWIYVGHVFRRADVFKAATKVAAATAPGPVGHLGLPVRVKIIKHIDAQRQELVSKALDAVHSTLDALMLEDGVNVCAETQCDTLLLGKLIRVLHKTRVWPRPAKPFTGVSFATIAKSVNGGGGLRLDSLAIHTSAATNRAQKLKKIDEAKWKTNGVNGHADESAPHVNGTGAALEVHDCHARRLVAHLGELGGLEDGVAGLELESSLGYQVY